MVSFTQLIATAIATAAIVVATPTPVAQAAPVTSETANLVLTVGDAFDPAAITENGTYSFTLPNALFSIERDPSNTNNVLISSPLGPCSVEATIFVCSATTPAGSFGFQTFGTGPDLSIGGVLSFNGLGFSAGSFPGGTIVNNGLGGESLQVVTQ